MEKKYCSLTFDDGPNLTTTLDMFSVLKKHCVKASFFVCGKNMDEKTRPVVKEIFDYGCTIENHSFSHSHMTELSAEQIKNEFDETSARIKEITGRMSEFFRAPFIDADEKVFGSIPVPFIEGENCEDWLAEIDSGTRFNRILSTISDGSILLLHDFEGNQATVDCIDRLIPELKKRGFEFLTVPEIFIQFKVNPDRHGHQWKNVRKEK